MASTLMKILVSLGLDSSEFDKGLGDAEGKAKGAGSNIAAGLSNIGGAVVLGGIAAAGAGVTALTGFLVSSIGPASDLNETLSKVGIVFGKNADEVIAFGQGAATALGMTENEALTAAGTYGNLFRAMGMTEDTGADMSISLVGLAGDLASFNNMDPTMVLDKLRAGLSGEVEPLRSLGVNLNQASIEAKALELGLWDGNDAIGAAAKAQASYALIMEQTTLAQGDFARTSEGLANQQRILKASFGDLKAKIGTALLPAVTSITKKIGELFGNEQFKAWIDGFIVKIGELAMGVVNAIPVVIAWFQNVATWLSENQGVMVGILAALGVAVAVFAYGVITSMAPVVLSMLPVIAVMAAIGAAAYLVYQAWTTNFGGIQSTLTALWTNTLQPIFSAIVTWFTTNIPVAIQALADFWNGTLVPIFTLLGEIWTTVLLPAMVTVFDWITANLIPLFLAVADVVGAVLGVALEALAGLWQNVLQPALVAMWNYLTNNIIPVVEKVAKWLNEKLAPAFEAISTAIGIVIGWLSDLATKLKNLDLPDWLTPGSPTPFEIGLLGIGAAMDTLNRKQLPEFQAGLELNPTVSGVTATGMGSGAAQFSSDEILMEIRALFSALPGVMKMSVMEGFAKAEN